MSKSKIWKVLLTLLGLTGILAFVLIWESPEANVERAGSIVPRDSREKVIFDYFYSLKNKQYSEAYKHLALDEVGNISLEEFVEDQEQKHSELATKISIGKETNHAKPGQDKPCDRTYEVFETHPTRGFTSGYVWLSPSPDNPEVCLIAYKAVFGY